MKSDNAPRTSIAAHIGEDLLGIETPAVIAGHEVPHHEAIVALNEMVLPMSQPAVRGTEERLRTLNIEH